MSSTFVNVPSVFEYHVYSEVAGCSVILVFIRTSLLIVLLRSISSLECFYLA